MRLAAVTYSGSNDIWLTGSLSLENNSGFVLASGSLGTGSLISGGEVDFNILSPGILHEFRLKHLVLNSGYLYLFY